jgi:hypothetical protein
MHLDVVETFVTNTTNCLEYDLDFVSRYYSCPKRRQKLKNIDQDFENLSKKYRVCLKNLFILE